MSVQLWSAHSHAYAQSPTVPEAGPSVMKSENVRITLEALDGAMIQKQNQKFSYRPVVMLPRDEFMITPDPGHLLCSNHCGTHRSSKRHG